MGAPSASSGGVPRSGPATEIIYYGASGEATSSANLEFTTGLWIGGYAPDANALGVVGNAQINGSVVVSAGQLSTSAGNISVADGFSFITLGRGGINNPSDGVLQLFNAAATNTARITVGAANLLTLNGPLQATGYIALPAGNDFGWQGRSAIFSPSDGVIELTNNAITGFNRLQLGGTTSSFPAIKVNGAALNFRLADDSGDAAITAGNIKVGSGSTFILGNAATTGLAPGVVAATTNATIVVLDSTGQAYRVPCII